MPDHVPDGDILVHTGDVSDNGTYEEMERMIEYFGFAAACTQDIASRKS